MKILVLKFKTIGDVLLITPLIRNLKYFYSNPLIDVAVNFGTEEMLTLNPNINKILVYNRKKIKNIPVFKKIYKEYKFVKSIRNSKYDIVIDLDTGDRGAFIAKYSGAKIKVGCGVVGNTLVNSPYTHVLPKKKKQHTIDINLDPLRVLNIPIKDKMVEIFWDKEDENFIVKKLLNVKRFVHVHPFSKVQKKEITSLSMAEIIDYCEIELGITVVMTSAPIKRELNKTEKIVNLCKSNPINLSGSLSLKQVAALNKKASFFVGVDTAIMHISAANNIPVLAFFGPTAVDSWGPWSNDLFESNYNRYSSFQQMGMHRVYAKKCHARLFSDEIIDLDMGFVKTKVLEIYNENSNT